VLTKRGQRLPRLLPWPALCRRHRVKLGVGAMDVADHVVSDVADVALGGVDIGAGRDHADHHHVEQRLDNLVDVGTRGPTVVEQRVAQGQRRRVGHVHVRIINSAIRWGESMRVLLYPG
jgi:hypothetical protein